MVDEIEGMKSANGYCNVPVIRELNRLEGYVMRLQPINSEIVACKNCMFSIDYYQDGSCYCKRPLEELRYIQDGWDFFCAAGKEAERG